MLVSLNWLNEYVDIKDIPVEELRKKMSAAGLSVERQRVVGEGLEGIVIGEIVEKVKHPDSDHLWITKVAIDESSKLEFLSSKEYIENILQIVTGAQNIEVGQKVPVVMSGSVLPGGFAIETTKLRGVESQGMMCSAKELGLGDDHDGILILDKYASVGGAFGFYAGLPDVVLDVEITPNRGDLLSMIGVAREVGVIFGRELKMPELRSLNMDVQNSNEKQLDLSVQIEDKGDCDRFAVVGLEGEFSEQTPFLVQQRLLRAGMRPISLLVDISNYVMLELGQPNHAYDARQVKNGDFYVRRAHFGEQLELLDGSKMDLDVQNLVISDAEKILGLAGIMGGETSKIQANANRIILEAAHFNGVVIRKTTMRKNVRSEASARFERKVDAALPVMALERFYALLAASTQVYVIGDLVDENHVHYSDKQVLLRSSKLITYIGHDLALGYVEKILNSLGFETLEATHSGEHGGWHIQVKVPTWRSADVGIEEDLIEEVARIYGYENIRVSTPKGIVPDVMRNAFVANKEKLVAHLVAQGWWELLTYSFNSEMQVRQSGFDLEKGVKVHNALTVEHQYMRMSLLPNLLQLIEKNARTFANLTVFECSRVYHQRLYSILPEELVNEELEREHLGMVWYSREFDFVQAHAAVTGALERVLGIFNLKGVKVVQDQEIITALPMSVMYHPGRVAAVMWGENLLGLVGQVHPRLRKEMGLQQDVVMAELDVAGILAEEAKVAVYEGFSVYPKTTESLSFVVDERVKVGEMVDVVKNIDAAIVEVQLLPVYVGEGVQAGKKAVTFEVGYQKEDGVMSGGDVKGLRDRVVVELAKEFGAEMRR